MARRFGATWWGRAWVEALEQRAGLDPNRLPRGRTYARHDRVARLEVEPGRISALVRGSRVLPYRVSVGVRTFDDATWDAVVGAVAARAGHAAALLDGDLDPAIVEDARRAGVELLPGPGDLQPRCSCPDWADPCKHSAAVCYLVADALDDDPFALFALRGRSREALLAAVRARRQDTGEAARPGGSGEGGALVDPGVPARTAWQGWEDGREQAGRRGAEEDHGPPASGTHPWDHLPDAPGTPAAWPADPPADAPFTADGLRRLATDAARRAWDQLADGSPSGLLLGRRADLARRAAGLLDAGEPLTDLARAAGETPTALANRAAIWRHAGEDGVEAAEETVWQPPEGAVDAALRAFVDAGVDPTHVRVRSNRLTAGDVQLRLTADGRWWRYERRGRSWELVEAPSDDPGDLVGDSW